MVYHNSFLIADPRTAWVLETAGPLWAAREVKTHHAISNGLTIGAEFDRSHPDLVTTARKKGWLKKGATFDFAACYADWLYTTFSACRRRQSRILELLEQQTGRLDPARAFDILRDHGEISYRPSSHFLGNRICAHAANPVSRDFTQTTSSLVAELTSDSRTYWATGTSAPCTSAFKPIRIGQRTLPDLGPVPTGTCDPASLWWRHETLHRALLKHDFEAGLDIVRARWSALEKSWLEKAADSGVDELYPLTSAAFRQAADCYPELVAAIRETGRTTRSGWFYRRYWAKIDHRAGFSLDR